ncbi:MAG: UDP-3-O-acyl-N-acetylglucosamine deacetylase [Deltaproteobacteria bacterium]|jgi:UDP-3-O-acyl N-acetylglucosamine deacetylase|nr:UDP-3-O-acyl-N-acetylglucosamine deacetylase [Deltaproteobacteria bacterium]
MSNLKLKANTQILIMVVDDETSICSALCNVLEDEHYATITANSGQEALEKVKQYHPDLIFLDIWMSGWDGIKTLECIKKISPDTEVIMISGHATISNALEATRRGAFDIIEKPFNIDSILLSVNRALTKTNKNFSGNDLNIDVLKNVGVLSTGLKGKNLGQRTLAKSLIMYGQCLHSGQKSGLVLEPLPLNSGLHFAKIGEPKTIPVFIDYVNSTSFATTITSERSSVSTIEHLMATLHAYKITNLLIKCNDEVPIFDGSAVEICKALESIGIEEQGGEWYEIKIDQPFEYRTKNKDDLGRSPEDEYIMIEPCETAGLTISYELNYPAPIGKQYFEFNLNSPQAFKENIAPARTFGFMKEVEYLQKAGLAAGGRLNNFILIGNDGVINTELRFSEELARHKILDLIGDFFLLGRPLQGRIRAVKTGHSDNAKLLSQLRNLAVSS